MVTSLAFRPDMQQVRDRHDRGMVQFLCFPPPGPMRPARHVMNDRWQLRRFQRPATCRSVPPLAHRHGRALRGMGCARPAHRTTFLVRRHDVRSVSVHGPRAHRTDQHRQHVAHIDGEAMAHARLGELVLGLEKRQDDVPAIGLRAADRAFLHADRIQSHLASALENTPPTWNAFVAA